MEEQEEKAIRLVDLKGEETEALLNHNTDFKTLIQVKNVPSEFKGYPKGTIISYAPLTLEELEVLNPSKDIEPTRAVAMLLNAIHCNTMKPEDLYYYDVMYIGIQRKLQAFGNETGLKYEQCPKCKKFVVKQFKYTDLSFKPLSAPDLPMKLKVAGKDIECYPLSIKSFLEFDVEDGELGILAREIRNLPYDEAYDLVRNATGVDIKKLRFVDRQLDYGLEPFVVNCGDQNPGCDAEVVLEVRSPMEIVFPNDIFEEDNDFEVQYG